MALFTRVCRALLGAIVGFYGSGWLVNFSVQDWLPLSLDGPSGSLLDAAVVFIIGIALGVLVAFVLSSGEPLPLWPVGAYVLGVLVSARLWLLGFTASDGVPVGTTPGIDWFGLSSWALSCFGPALGALVVLAIMRRASAVGTAGTPKTA